MHDWKLTPKEAIALQRQLAQQVIRQDQLGVVRFIAGVDMAMTKHKNIARAAVVLMSYPALEMIEHRVHEEPLRMPYIPGLLSFREAPVIMSAFNQLEQRPDLVMVDGTGIAHPRRLGIASHLGLWWNLPTIGCAKSILVGTYQESLLKPHAGSWTPLIDKEEVIGAAVRTKTHVKPLFVSLGHKISLETSIDYVLSCSTYRLPEPIRQADKLSKSH